MNEMFQLYMNSSNSLLCAMKSAIQLINIESQLHLSSLIDSNIQNNNTESQIKNISLLLQKVELVKNINNQLVDSCRSIINLQQKILEQSGTDGITTPYMAEISLVQQQLKAILDFCQKDFVKTHIDISNLTSDVSSILMMIKMKYGDLEKFIYYKPILNHLSDLYNLCLKSLKDK